MYMYIYACVCVCIFTYMFTCVNVGICMCKCVHAYESMGVYAIECVSVLHIVHVKISGWLIEVSSSFHLRPGNCSQHYASWQAPPLVETSQWFIYQCISTGLSKGDFMVVSFSQRQRYWLNVSLCSCLLWVISITLMLLSD